MVNSRFIQVYTTFAKKSGAERIARRLSDRRLSACAQIVGPITSVYRWKGKVQTSKEWLCVIKTKMGKYKGVEKIIKSAHAYELPEIIAVPIIAGSAEYLAWMRREI